MKKIVNFLFSMSFVATLIVVMIISTATATFIESAYGPLAARAAVYNTKWFELLLLLILINLIGNMIRNKIYRAKKVSIFIFHFAFLFIFIGAAVTRYVGYEGTMHIRENESSDRIISSDTYLSGTINDGAEKIYFKKKTQFIPGKRNRFKSNSNLGNKKLKLKLIDFIPYAEKSMVPDPLGHPMISFITLGPDGRHSYVLQTSETVQIDSLLVGFNNKGSALNIISGKSGLYFNSINDITLRDMTSVSDTIIKAGKFHPLLPRKIYSTGNIQLVLRNYLKTGKITWKTGPDDGRTRQDALLLEATYKSQKDTVTCLGKSGMIGQQFKYKINGAELVLNYGALYTKLPFKIFLKDFVLERYPGSNSPASYESKVKLIDRENNIEKSVRIYMNNILKFKGYRFFQSSFDKDEMGTILSVSHDALGTSITYTGYFLMTLGMILSVFNKNSRFRQLARSGRKNKLVSVGMGVILIYLLSPSYCLNAQTSVGKSEPLLSTKQANEFSSVLVQDKGGRIEPLQTLASDVIRKISLKESIKGMNSVQVFLGMYFNPEKWRTVPMIKISNEDIRDMVGVTGKYASYVDFFDKGSNGNYKLYKYVQNIYRKRPGLRTKLDKEIMKVDERVNVSYMVYNGSFLRIFPIKDDPDKKWYGPDEASELLDSSDDSLFVKEVLATYRNVLISNNDNRILSEILSGIKKYQKVRAGTLYPSKSKISLEIIYNRVDIFKKLVKYYGIIGFILLIMLLVSILKEERAFRKFIIISSFLLFVGFVFHTAGLAVRWYISGYAPMSNGYESMIYIGWASMLAGLIFYRKSVFTMVAASLLSSLTLLVAHMSWINPEITNLVPVLKSYWLTIHVSVITASYGFLGTGMVLGLFSIVLYLMKTKNNNLKLQEQIDTLTRINEMSLILGVYFISTGTFLGAVWANESWGRYWGWDPKETWALITTLVYIFITHMRFVPGLKGAFAFNLASVAGFFSVLMTYFGVNYYLSGLHSYVQGEAASIPGFVYIIIFSLTILIYLAWVNEKKQEKKVQNIK